MRLKKAGYIEDRKFVIQPSQQVIDDALEGKEGLGYAIKGIFGGGGDGDSGVNSGSVVSVSDSSKTAVEEASAEQVVSEPEDVDAATVESN
jgi:hypothetical protein